MPTTQQSTTPYFARDNSASDRQWHIQVPTDKSALCGAAPHASNGTWARMSTDQKVKQSDIHPPCYAKAQQMNLSLITQGAQS